MQSHIVCKKMVNERQKAAVQYMLSAEYGYYYLRNRLKKACSDKCTTLIFGSSYGIHGIYDANTEIVANLSGIAQDLFCHLKLYEKCVRVRHGNGLGDVIILAGYYLLYDDLSYAGEYAALMERVYEPLIQDSHHFRSLHTTPQQRAILNLPEITEEQIQYGEILVDAFFDENNFFNRIMRCEDHRVDLLQGEDWKKISRENRMKMAETRAEQHNQLLKNGAVFQENCELMESMLKQTEKQRSKVWVIIPPFTKEYLLFLNQDMKESLLSVIENFSYTVDYVDLNTTDFFEDSDFLDMDHLNGQGAIKMTNILSAILERRL